jgi:membrane protease YdiL (CAAX protease family)
MMGLGVLVIGLVLALAFRRRGDVAVCVVAHGVFDAVQLLVVLPLVAARL